MTQETAGSINVFVRSSYREVKYNQTIHGKCNYSGLWVLRAKIESHAINRQGIQNLIPVQCNLFNIFKRFFFFGETCSAFKKQINTNYRLKLVVEGLCLNYRSPDREVM